MLNGPHVDSMFLNKLTPPAGHKLFFKDLIKSYLNLPIEGYFFNSGTTALYFLVQNLNIPTNSNILIPAYSCPTVAAAILRAGHYPVLADINFENLGYNIESFNKIISRNTVKAIIKVNLFGLSSPPINTSLPVIEDNAQCNPLFQKSNNSSACIYSFGRGKPINSLGGGVAQIIDKKKFVELDKKYNSILTSKSSETLKYLMNFLAYKFFYNSILYKILYSIPQLHLGKTIFNLDFKICKMNSINRKVIKNIVTRMEQIESLRIKICNDYDKIMEMYKEHFIFYPQNIFYRYPVIVKSENKRDFIVEALQKEGIGAFPLYPKPLNSQPGLKEILKDNTFYPNAEFISQNLFTLPVNEFIKEKQINKIIEVFKDSIK